MALPLTQLDASGVDEAEAKLPPPAVNSERPLVKLTVAQKKKLLKQAGMQELELHKLKAVKEVGEFVSQLGLYAIGVGKLAAAQSDLELIFAKTVAEAKKAKDDPEMQARLFAIQELLFRLRLETIKLEFKAASEFKPQPLNSAGGRPPIPFPAGVAVQVNNYPAPAPEHSVKS